MKSTLRQFAAFATAFALLGAQSTPLQSAPADEEFGAFDPATVLKAASAQTGELLAFDMNRIVTQQTRILRYQATEYQREVAEQRARAYVAAQRRAIATARPPAPSKKVAKTSKEEPKPSKGVAKKSPEPKPDDPKVAEQPRKLPRYIAVDTVKDKRASPTAKKVVMIWDTQSESLVGNNIYDVQNPPHIGATTTLETYSAQYIGAGL